jgi:hypothetical protein
MLYSVFYILVKIDHRTYTTIILEFYCLYLACSWNNVTSRTAWGIRGVFSEGVLLAMKWQISGLNFNKLSYIVHLMVHFKQSPCCSEYHKYNGCWINCNRYWYVIVKYHLTQKRKILKVNMFETYQVTNSWVWVLSFRKSFRISLMNKFEKYVQLHARNC